jgi:uncharacterized protein DUF955
VRRGFKSEARDTANTVRSELGLGPLDRLHPIDLAGHLDIPVLTLSSFLGECPAVAPLVGRAKSSFSAVTVLNGPERVIVVNDTHTSGRQANSIAHELSHGLLMHPATPPFDARGLRNHQVELEEEASHLAGCLLISDHMCMQIVRLGISQDQAAAQLGVSAQLVRWRVNQSGAVKRVARAAARW